MPESRLKAHAGPLLLLLGVIAYAAGAWHHGLPWSGSRAAARDTLWAFLLAFALIALLSRLTGRADPRRGFALLLAALWLLAGGVMEIVGPLAVLATGAVAATLLPAAGLPVLVRLVAGLGLVAATVGWALPFPVHVPLVWVAVLASGIAWRRRALRDLWRELRRDAHADLHGGGAALWLFAAVAIVAIAPALLPRLGPDDLSYHLMIPRELLAFGHSRLDAGTQAWVFAPWSLDLLHGLAWVFAGAEPVTAGLNIFWFLAAATLCARIGRELGLGPRGAWLAASVYASVPMVSQLAGNLQVEAASPAILAALYLAVARAREPGALLLVAALAGFLMGSKTSNALLALPVAAWLLWRLRGAWPAPADWARAIALGAFVAGSSYVWAAVLAGNPVLPLFNGVFESPYFAPDNWRDDSWQLPWGPGLPWAIVFDTGRYLSAYAGALGAFWIVLAGALPLALRDARTRPALLVAIAAMLLLFSQVQYLRYLLPATVLLVPALFAALAPRAPRASTVAGCALVLLQVLSIPTASWIFVGRLLKLAVTDGQAAVVERFADEQRLVREFERLAGPGDRLLFTDRFRPYVAGAPGRSSSVSWYDAEMSALFRDHGGYSHPEAWRLARVASGANYFMVSHGEAKDGLGAVLDAHAAEVVARGATSDLYRLELGQAMDVQVADGAVVASATPAGAWPAVGSARLRVACDQPGKPVAVAWTLLSPDQAPAQRWTWVSCDTDGRADAGLVFSTRAPVVRLQVVAQPAPPSAGMVVQPLDTRLDLRRDLLADRSPVLRHAAVFCPRLAKPCRDDWATLETTP